MKKILPIFLIAFLAACGGSDNDNDTSGASGTEQGAGGAGGTAGGTAGGAQGEVADGDGTGNSGTAGGNASGDSGAEGGDAGTPGGEENGNFALSTYQQNLGEIELAQLAIDQAEDENVRRFAQRMLAHHQFMNARITELAQGLGLTLPTELGADFDVRRQNLANLSGAEFDRAYVGHNLTLHQQAVAQFREQAESAPTSGGTGTADDAAAPDDAGTTATGAGADGTSGTGTSEADQGSSQTQLQGFAANALPALQVHLLVAKALAGALDPAVFLANLYQDGLAEIQLSTLALQQASDAGVRAYAQRMIDDHTRANQQIAQLAQANGIDLPDEPTADQRALSEDLALMQEADFDKAYMNHNVLAHEIAIAQTRVHAEGGSDGEGEGGTAGAGATGGANAEIMALAGTLLPELEAHLESANTLYEGLTPSLLFGAFQSGMGQVLLSQLAVQLSENAEVQQFASSMIEEHGTANLAILQLAQQNEHELPNEVGAEHARAYVQLSQLTGQEFDRAFMEHNLQMHAQAVQLFETGQANEQDADVQSFAAEALPVLREHLQRAEELEGQVGNAEE
jgi:predicted outer membrane protein